MVATLIGSGDVVSGFPAGASSTTIFATISSSKSSTITSAELEKDDFCPRRLIAVSTIFCARLWNTFWSIRTGICVATRFAQAVFYRGTSLSATWEIS